MSDRLIQALDDYQALNYRALDSCHRLQDEVLRVLMAPRRVRTNVMEIEQEVRSSLDDMLAMTEKMAWLEHLKSDVACARSWMPTVQSNLHTAVEQVDFINRFSYQDPTRALDKGLAYEHFQQRMPSVVKDVYAFFLEQFQGKATVDSIDDVDNTEEMIRFLHQTGLQSFHMPCLDKDYLTDNYEHEEHLDGLTKIGFLDDGKGSFLHEVFKKYYSRPFGSTVGQNKAFALVGRNFAQYDIKFGKHFANTRVVLDEKTGQGRIDFRWVDSAYNGKESRIRLIDYILGEKGFSRHHENDRVVEASRTAGIEETKEILDYALRAFIGTNDLDISWPKGGYFDVLKMVWDKGGVKAQDVVRTYGWFREDDGRQRFETGRFYHFFHFEEDRKILRELGEAYFAGKPMIPERLFE